MTLKQLEASMDMMRSVCAPKFKSLSTDLLDGLRKGDFVEDKDLKVIIKIENIMNYKIIFYFVVSVILFVSLKWLEL